MKEYDVKIRETLEMSVTVEAENAIQAREVVERRYKDGSYVMRRDSPKQVIIPSAFGLIPVVWAALLVAPAVSGGLPEILQNLTVALNNPKPGNL